MLLLIFPWLHVICCCGWHSVLSMPTDPRVCWYSAQCSVHFTFNPRLILSTCMAAPRISTLMIPNWPKLPSSHISSVLAGMYYWSMFFARMTCNKLYYWQSWSHVCWLMYFYILDSKFTDIERVEIPFQSSVKYLGVHLSQVLSMQRLISSIYKADFLQVCKICKHICCKVLIAYVLLDLSLCIGYCMTAAAMFCRAYLLTLSCAWKELRIMLHASSFIYCAKLQH